MAIAGIAAVVGLGALIALNQPAAPASSYVIVDHDETTTATRVDPLRTELIRCRSLPTDSDDGACRAAWEANRQRFFGETWAMHLPPRPQPNYAPNPVLPRAPADSAPVATLASPER